MFEGHCRSLHRALGTVVTFFSLSPHSISRCLREDIFLDVTGATVDDLSSIAAAPGRASLANATTPTRLEYNSQQAQQKLAHSKDYHRC